MRVLVDTDVVSYAYRKEDVFLSFYGPKLLGHVPYVSFVTLAELEYGVRRRNWGPRRQQDLRNFVAAKFSELFPTRETSLLWGELVAEAELSGRHLKEADGWIAAIALHYDVPLMTNNRRDFDFLDGLTIISAA